MAGNGWRCGPWGVVEVDGCCFILTDPRKGVLRILEMGFE